MHRSDADSAQRARGAREYHGAARDRRVQRVILIEGALNATVAAVKAGVGFATGSLAILSDSVHSLTDLANNVVAWAVIRWSSRPPDADHPYGHRKFETIAVFLLAVVLTVTAFELAAQALRRGRPEVAGPTWAVVGMLGVLAINTGMALWERMWAVRLDSDILRADSRHTISDVLTTLVAIAGWQAATRGYPWLDTAASLGVAVLILFLAYGLFRRSLPILVDRVSIDPDAVSAAARTVSGVHAVRRVRSRSYGREAAVDLVIVVAPDLPTAVSHEIATRVEQAIESALPVETVTVHIEPEGARHPPPPDPSNAGATG